MIQIAGLSETRHLTREELTGEIPAMPVVAMRAMRELGDPDTNAKKVADIIAMDQSMTSRILRLANSPVFGARRKIVTVNDALVLIGFSALKGLVIAVSTRGIYQRAGLLEQLLWEHSVGCGVAASAVSREIGGISPDEAFVGGLMHDIGRAIFANLYRQDYELMFQHIYNNDLPRATLIDFEVSHFGLSHMELGKLVVEKWGLSAELAEVVGAHHANSLDELNALEYKRAVATIGLANAMCMHLAIGMRKPDSSVALYESAFAQVLELSSEKIAEILERVLETFEAEKSTFDI